MSKVFCPMEHKEYAFREEKDSILFFARRNIR